MSRASTGAPPCGSGRSGWGGIERSQGYGPDMQARAFMTMRVIHSTILTDSPDSRLKAPPGWNLWVEDQQRGVWFRRHEILTAVAGLIGLLALIGALGSLADATDMPTPSAAAGPVDSSTPQSAADKASAAGQAKADAAAKAQAEAEAAAEKARRRAQGSRMHVSPLRTI